MRGRWLAVVGVLVATLALQSAASVAVAGEGTWPERSGLGAPMNAAGEGPWPV